MIVDWRENCEKIFKTHKITVEDPSDRKSRFQQEIIYLNFLRSVKKYSDERMFRNWKRIKNGTARIFRDDPEQLMSRYEALRNKSEKAMYKRINVIEHLNPVRVYYEELDFLNSLPAPMWVRQYWACLMFYYKFASQTQKRVAKTPTLNAWCIRHTDYRHKNYGGECQDLIASYKISCKIGIISDFPCIGKERYATYRPEFILQDGHTAMIASSISEIDEFLQLIEPNKAVCTQCGAKFDISSKTKRTICEKCYKIMRKEYLRDKKRLERAMSTGKQQNVNMVRTE